MTSSSGAAIRCVPNADFRGFLERRRRPGGPQYEVDLPSVFSHILEKANAFVPSRAGSVFLDDPSNKRDERADNTLVFVAAFGESADELVGQRLPANKGIVGKVYQSGAPYRSDSPRSDASFNVEIDNATEYTTLSVICVPLRIEGEVVGVIELLNRVGSSGYSQTDLELLEIFAQTISTSLTNALDAVRAKELARRDDLSGLYNDRYFHEQLGVLLGACIVSGNDCGLLFFDLDHFKIVNDTHGHLSGSRVLREIGGILQELCVPPTLAARYGGDEFVIIYPATGPRELAVSAERIRTTIEEHVFLEEADPLDPNSLPALHLAGVITCSIGIASLRADVGVIVDDGAEEVARIKGSMLRVADARMYLAKERGKNRVVGCEP